MKEKISTINEFTIKDADENESRWISDKIKEYESKILPEENVRVAFPKLSKRNRYGTA